MSYYNNHFYNDHSPYPHCENNFSDDYYKNYHYEDNCYDNSPVNDIDYKFDDNRWNINNGNFDFSYNFQDNFGNDQSYENNWNDNPPMNGNYYSNDYEYHGRNVNNYFDHPHNYQNNYCDGDQGYCNNPPGFYNENDFYEQEDNYNTFDYQENYSSSYSSFCPNTNSSAIISQSESLKMEMDRIIRNIIGQIELKRFTNPNFDKFLKEKGLVNEDDVLSYSFPYSSLNPNSTLEAFYNEIDLIHDEIRSLYKLLEFNESNQFSSEIYQNERLVTKPENEKIEMDKCVELNIAQEETQTSSLGQPSQEEEFNEYEYYLEQEKLWDDFEAEYQETLKYWLDQGILVRVNSLNNKDEIHNSGVEKKMPEESSIISPIDLEEKIDEQDPVCSLIVEEIGEQKSKVNDNYFQITEGIDQLEDSTKPTQNLYFEKSPLEIIIQGDLLELPKNLSPIEDLFEPFSVKPFTPKVHLLDYLICWGVIRSFYDIFILLWLHEYLGLRHLTAITKKKLETLQVSTPLDLFITPSLEIITSS